MNRFRGLLLLLTVPGLFVAACASTSKDRDEPLASVDALTADAGTVTCGDGGTQRDCLHCVESSEAAGFTAYIAVVRGDVCQVSNCADACGATYCAKDPTSPDLGCLACANDALTNDAVAVAQACRADTSCAAFDAALRNANCNALPN